MSTSLNRALFSHTATHLEVLIEPDTSIWNFDPAEHQYEYAKLLEELSYLMHNVRFTAITQINWAPHRNTFHAPRGLLDLLQREVRPKCQEPMLEAHVAFKEDGLMMEAAFLFEFALDQVSGMRSFANYEYMHEGGTHLQGFYKGIKQALADWNREVAPEIDYRKLGDYPISILGNGRSRQQREGLLDRLLANEIHWLLYRR